MMRAVLSLILGLGLAQAAPAQDLSSEAEFYVAEHVKGGCDGRGGYFDAGVWEQDLTDDGLADLIVDHNGLVCDGAEPSGFCNTRSCALFFYVRGEDGLDETLRGLGQITAVSDDLLPLIGLVTAAGPSINLRWDGTSFTPVFP